MGEELQGVEVRVQLDLRLGEKLHDALPDAVEDGVARGKDNDCVVRLVLLDHIVYRWGYVYPVVLRRQDLTNYLVVPCAT